MQDAFSEPTGFVAMLHEGALFVSGRKTQECICAAHTIGYMTDSSKGIGRKVVKKSSCYFHSDVIMYLVS